MLGIGSFFDKFKNLQLGELAFRAAIIDSIKENLGFELKPSQINYRDAVVTLQIPPSAKAALMIKKTQILKKIQERTSRVVKDIR